MSPARARRVAAASVIVGLALMGAVLPAAAAPADRQHSPVRWFDDLSEVAGATAELRRTDSGAGFTLRTQGLTAGDAVTVWWVIFNHPEFCQHPFEEIGAPCSVPDLFNPDVAATVMFAAGNVVGGSGASTFAGHLRQGQTTTYHPFFEGAPGLLNPRGADIHLVVRTHGELIPDLADEMLRTFEGGCTPETSDGFGEGSNACADLQFAIFAP